MMKTKMRDSLALQGVRMTNRMLVSILNLQRPQGLVKFIGAFGCDLNISILY